jgi:alpha-methylacyl-CoA racemase
MRPLEGITVLDFSTLLPGPMATLILAEAGAEVIKIERPARGEEMRSYRPKWGSNSINFALLNRGKKSIAVDLKDPGERAKLDRLIARTDIVVEQFRPGVMARLGLDYATLARNNPRIIYCAITGYGQSGPKRDSAGHDLNYIGDTGLLALSMGDPEHPVVPPALIADIAGGAYPAVMNILLALLHRNRSGRGCQLDIAMTDNLFPFMYWAMGDGLAAAQWAGNGTALVCGGTPRYRLYPTRDGQVVAAAPIEQKFWDEFCDLIGLDADLRDDSRDPAATERRVTEIIRAEPGETWRQRFAGRDCCCSVVVDLQQALKDPHFRARGLFDHVLLNEHGARLPALPVPVERQFRSATETASPAPVLGANNSEFNL